MKAKGALSLGLIAAMIACPVFFVPAVAVNQGVLNASKNQLSIWTEECLQEASASDKDSYQRNVLKWGVDHPEPASARFGPHTQLDQAIAYVQSTLDDVKNKEDSEKFQQDINQALQDVRPLISNDDSAQSGPTPAAPFTLERTAPERNTPTVTLTPAQSQAVVLIKGDNGEGTGFLVKTADGPTVITNIHVISNNPNLKITTSSGTQITAISFKGATDRDLAMIVIKDDNYSYLTLATDVSATAEPGDEVVTPGNSEGGEVMLNTDGEVLGIGPERIEFSNPVYHGNSGGPVFHTKSGQVIGVVSMGIPVMITDDLDKTSFESRNSAIAGAMRFFGLRVDNVPKWEPYDWDHLQNETLFLDQFHHRSMCLDAFLNGSVNSMEGNSVSYLSDEKLKKAVEYCIQQCSGGADNATRNAAYQELLSDLNGIADTDMAAIKQPEFYYSFDQQRARNELAYRQNIKKELNFISNDLGRLGYKLNIGN